MRGFMSGLADSVQLQSNIQDSLVMLGVSEQIFIFDEITDLYAVAADGRRCALLDGESANERLMALSDWPDNATDEEKLASIWQALQPRILPDGQVASSESWVDF